MENAIKTKTINGTTYAFQIGVNCLKCALAVHNCGNLDASECFVNTPTGRKSGHWIQVLTPKK